MFVLKSKDEGFYFITLDRLNKPVVSSFEEEARKFDTQSDAERIQYCLKEFCNHSWIVEEVY